MLLLLIGVFNAYGHEGPKKPAPRIPRSADLDLSPSQDPKYKLRLEAAKHTFDDWLSSRGLSLVMIAVSGVLLAQALRAYGLWLYRQGAPRYLYVDTINGVLVDYDVWRMHMPAAWKVSRRWQEQVPGRSRAIVPRVLLMAMVSLALLWNWPFFAANTALGFCGILHPAEFLENRRDSLILPSDALYSADDAYLFIEDPKTQRFARHQHARVGDPSVIALLETTFKGAEPAARLWPFSKHSYRKCWDAVLQHLGVPHLTRDGGPTPGSLRGSGATDLYMQRMELTKIQWLGRWRRLQTLEYYLQEVAAKSLLPRLSPQSRQLVSLFSDAAASLVASYVETGSPSLWALRLTKLFPASLVPQGRRHLRSDRLTSSRSRQPV